MQIVRFAFMAGQNAEGPEPSARSLSRALEAKTRRLAAERLELAERMEREVADVRAESDARVTAERDRAKRLEAELADARAALAELQRSKTFVVTAPMRWAYHRLRGRR